MAFTATPTAGNTNIFFTAGFLNRLGVDLGLYRVALYASTSVGSCPAVPVTGTNQVEIANALFVDGEYTLMSASVPAGSCRVYNLLIIEIASNTIVSQLSDSIDRV